MGQGPPGATGNVWIIKPVAASKGEGIRVFNAPGPALAHAATLGYDAVAQKYIERPLLVARKKASDRVCVRVCAILVYAAINECQHMCDSIWRGALLWFVSAD